MGTLRINQIPAKVLFDSGASHSFLSQAFSQMHGISFKGLSVPLLVQSPGYRWCSTMVSHGNLIEVAFQLFPTSLIALKSTDIDIILGMDWLTRYQVFLDCTTKSITLTSPDGITVKYCTVGSLSVTYHLLCNINKDMFEHCMHA